MKKIILSVLALMISVGVYSQTLDEIIAKNLAAEGGVEKLKKVNSMVIEATINAQGQEMPIKISILHKKGFRMDMTIMGMENYTICNAKAGYNFFPIGGQKEPEAMPADQVKSMIEDFDLYGDFIDYKERGYKLELQGEEDVDGTMCYKILSISPSKSEKRIYIDKETFHVIKEVSKVNVNGKDIEQVSELSNFKTVDGYTFPYEMTGPMGPMKISKYTINSDVKESLFELKK